MGGSEIWDKYHECRMGQILRGKAEYNFSFPI